MFYLIAILWLCLDQFTKNLVQTHLLLGESLPIIPNIFHLTYILNRGAAFGILSNQRIFFLFIAGVLIAICFYFQDKIREGGKVVQFGSAILVAGTLGNAIDRYMNGAVVDFFDFRFWPIFNVADIGICVGVVIIAWYIWQGDSNE